MLRRVEIKVRTLRKPVEQVTRLPTESRASPPATDGDKVQSVTIRPARLRDRLFSHTSGVVTAAGVTVALLFFLLASGDMFLRKIVHMLPSLGDKKLAVEVARRIESDISRYLLSVTLINAGLGVTVGVALALIGMPNPVLWAPWSAC